MSRPFRTIHNISTGETRTEYLTDEEISERQARAAAEAEQQAKQKLETDARRDAAEYMMQFVAGRPDAPQSVKDFVSQPQIGKRK